MIFEQHIPKGLLSRYIDCFIYFEQYETPYLIERFLPDGNVELVINLTETPQHIYDNDSLVKIQKCERAWASGVRTRPISIPAGHNAKMFVVIFKKGMAHPFFPVPMNELTDTVVEADYLWGNEVSNLRERLAEASDVHTLFDAAGEFLTGRLMHGRTARDFIEYGVGEIIANPSGVYLSRLTEKIGYSKRHFIAKFKASVGLSPKSYMRVLRFQKAINEIESDDVDWPDIALDCGYYDQSHFINDFRVFSGFTPSDYLKKKNGNINYVPVA